MDLYFWYLPYMCMTVKILKCVSFQKQGGVHYQKFTISTLRAIKNSEILEFGLKTLY